MTLVTGWATPISEHRRRAGKRISERQPGPTAYFERIHLRWLDGPSRTSPASGCMPPGRGTGGPAFGIVVRASQRTTQLAPTPTALDFTTRSGTSPLLPEEPNGRTGD